MTKTADTEGIGNSLLSNVFFLALVTAGLVGNYFSFPIFMNVDFIFGSIFALLALQFFGLGRGVIAAALIASYTYVLWNHPYAIVIMTVEVLVVGWLMSRTKIELVMADTLYWLVIGLPLVFLFYHIVMQTPLSNTYIIMAKQAVNGIANALAARLIYTGFLLRSRSALISYRESIYNLLVLFVLCPTLILLAVSSQNDFARTDASIRTMLTQESRHMSLLINSWLKNRTSAIVSLAERAATLTPEQMQDRLDLARAADGNFLRIGMRSNDSVVMAYSPKFDDDGKSNVGKKFPERPYIPTIRKTLKPLLAEVVTARINEPKPAAIMLTPILIDGQFSGYINGVLNLNQIEMLFTAAAAQTTYLYTVFDQKGHVITTNRTDQTVMQPFERGEGNLLRFDDDISQWMPTLTPNSPAIRRWEKSLYIAETAVGSQAEWTLILEQPVSPFQKELYNNYSEKLFILFLLLLLAMFLAKIASRLIVSRLEQINEITCALPVTLTTIGEEILWPESRVVEAAQLIGNFKQMASSLTEQFQKVEQSNESLEQRVAERTTELTSAISLLSATLEATTDGIIVVDKGGHVSRWNEHFVDLWQVPGEILDTLDADRFLNYTRALLQRPGDFFAEVAALSNNQEESRGGMLSLLDGRVFEWHTQPYRIDKAITGRVWCFRDITEHRRNEEERQKLEKLESIGVLAGGIAHNFNNVLTSLYGNVALAKMKLASDHPGYRFLEAVESSMHRATSLTNQLLTFSKGGEPVRQTLSLGHLIEEVVAFNLSGSKVKPVVELPDSLWSAKADQEQMRQVLTNLVINARQAMPDGGHLYITVENAEVADEEANGLTAGRYLRLTVSDEGAGIAAEHLNQVFVPYFTTKETGLGLGLATAYSIVKKHGGHISATSRIGKGMTFTLYLPAASDAEPPLAQPEPALAPQKQSAKILVMDDEPMIRSFLQEMLRESSYAVETAMDGHQAIDMYRHAKDAGHPFDVVIMDLTIPGGMGGQDAAKSILQIDPQARLIVSSGYADDPVMANYADYGFKGVASKPYSPGELLEVLSRILGNA